MRTIRVTGRGQLKLRPDTTRITVQLDGLHEDYAETLRRSSDDTDVLKTVLSGFGFERSDLKTLSFGVDPEYEGYQDTDGTYKQRFRGYRFRHALKVEFPSDNERLGKILYALACCPVCPELRLSYTVSDPEAAKNTLLEKAVADAREKAVLLARAAGVVLGELRSIDYSRLEIEFDSRPMRSAVMNAKAADSSFSMDLEPDDIQVNDTVTAVWEIV